MIDCLMLFKSSIKTTTPCRATILALALSLTIFTPAIALSTPKPCHGVSVFHFSEMRDWQNGLTTSSGVQTLVGEHINDTLLRQSGSEITPGVIASITKDIKTNLVTLHIDQNCKWSNGNSISSNDVKAGLESVFHPQASRGIPRNGLFVNGPSVLEGEKTLSFLGIETPTSSTVSFESDYGISAIKRILSLPYYIPLPSWQLVDNPDFAVSSNLPTVFSGPYILTEYQPPNKNNNATISLTANPNYCGTPPFYKEVTLLGVTHAEQFIDIASQRNDIINYIPIDPQNLTKNLISIDWIAQEYTVRYDVKSHIALIRYNAANGPLVEPNLRRALTLAIDWNGPTGVQKRLIENSGRLSLSKSLVPPDYMKNVPTFQRDTRDRKTRLKEATAILLQHGYDKNNPLQLTAAFSTYQRNYFYLAKEMIEAGLPVQINETEYTIDVEYFQSVLLSEHTPFDLSLTDWGSTAPWPSTYIDYYYNNNIIPDNLKSKGNDMLHMINTAKDAKQTHIAEHKALSNLLSEHIFIPFFDAGAAALFHKSVTNVEKTYGVGVWSLIGNNIDQCKQ